LVDPTHPQVAATLTLDKRKMRRQFHSVAFDPDGQMMATGHGDAIRIWDLTSPHRPYLVCTKRPIKRCLWGGTVFSLVFTSDGHCLLADGGNGIAVTELIGSTWVDFPVTPTDTWPVERQMSTHMSSLAPHPNGRFLAGIRRYDVAFDESAVAEHKGVVVWDVRDVRAPRPIVVLLDRKEIRKRPSAQWPLRLVGHEGQVNDVTFSPDGTLLATAGSDPTVLIWDTNDLPQLRLMAILDTPQPARQVRFSADGQLLATYDGTTTTLWNSPTATNE
jgi:WD40 repeat protein